MSILLKDSTGKIIEMDNSEFEKLKSSKNGQEILNSGKLSLLNNNDNDEDSLTTSALDFARGLGQGVTFGFSDEILAGGKALVDKFMNNKEDELEKIYNNYLELERKKLKESEERSPYLYTAGEFSGGVVPGIGVGKVAKGVVDSIKTIPNLTKSLLSSTVEGGISGALESIGTSENKETKDIIQGGLIGSGIGGVIGGVGNLVNKTSDVVSKLLKDHSKDFKIKGIGALKNDSESFIKPSNLTNNSDKYNNEILNKIESLGGSSSETLYKNVSKKVEETGKEFESLIDKLKQKNELFLKNKENSNEYVKNLLKDGLSLTEKEINNLKLHTNEDAVNKYGLYLEKIKDEINNQLKSGNNLLETLITTKQTIGDIVGREFKSQNPSNDTDILINVYGKLNDIIKNHIKDISPEDLDIFLKKNKDFHEFKTIQDILDNTLKSQVVRSKDSILKNISPFYKETALMASSKALDKASQGVDFVKKGFSNLENLIKTPFIQQINKKSTDDKNNELKKIQNDFLNQQYGGEYE